MKDRGRCAPTGVAYALIGAAIRNEPLAGARAPADDVAARVAAGCVEPSSRSRRQRRRLPEQSAAPQPVRAVCAGAWGMAIAASVAAVSLAGAATRRRRRRSAALPAGRAAGCRSPRRRRRRRRCLRGAAQLVAAVVARSSSDALPSYTTPVGDPPRRRRPDAGQLRGCPQRGRGFGRAFSPLSTVMSAADDITQGTSR